MAICRSGAAGRGGERDATVSVVIEAYEFGPNRRLPGRPPPQAAR
jgi:hypothetical protein